MLTWWLPGCKPSNKTLECFLMFEQRVPLLFVNIFSLGMVRKIFQ